MTTNKNDDVKKADSPAPRPPTATRTQETQGRAEGAAPQFSITAVAEELPPARPSREDREADQKAATAKVAPLQKEYDGLLEQIKTTVDPLARAQLVNRKGNVTREMDAIKRPARLP